MSGVGSSVLCQLPKHITSVLKADDGKVPVATRLACTLGPQSNSVPVLKEMLTAGMKIARLDFTYGDMALHLESYRNLKQAMQETNTLCAIMLNPAGPDIHVINRQGPIQLAAGQTIKLTNDASQQASAALLPVNWPGSFTQSGLAVGSTIFIGQYLFSGAETTSVYLTVQSVEPSVINCVINNNCSLEGVQLTVKFDASARSPLPCLGEADEKALVDWVAATAADSEAKMGAGEFVALPRTRSAADVQSCRDLLARIGLGHAHVVAKFEDLEGLVAHSEVLAAADAVIFSRGSLGTCMEPEKVFLAQKMLLHAANSQGKPVFVTRVVDTMTDAPRPTRAEATDVANLVLDGADGVLLGSETFRGKYPVDSVRTVAAICRAAEAVFDNYAFYRGLIDSQYNPLNPAGPKLDRAEALASSAVRAANKMSAKLIVVFTVTGRTARLLAKYKPQQPILTVVCTDPNSAQFSALGRNNSGEAAQQQPAAMKKVGSDTLLNLGHLRTWSHGSQAKGCLVYRGALPIMADAPKGSNSADLLEAVLDYAKETGLVSSGDRVVVSQCPRTIDSQVMSEAGVVQLVTVDEKLM